MYILTYLYLFVKHYDVSGMTCAACSARVERVTKGIDGVDGCEVNLLGGTMTVETGDENVKAAIIVSSVTFGIGHIINLINGSGAELLPNLLQVIYATAAGFMFVMMYYKSKSLIVCIFVHGAFNALSVFANEANANAEMRILTAILLTAITGSYALYLALSMKGETND